ncbi:MAG: NifB/NifX family molybdenum-iron cluster-binding protein [Candidatus Marinimicrobia bacterium]|nr:NifB/NifX family molybdenum-iron cluster-binding protein [Candidatus Neomarinimicrobiota bacterium]
MNIVFTTKGTTWDSAMDPRFGRTEYFIILDEEKNELKAIDNSEVTQEAHGAGPKAAQKLFEEKADILITGNGPGGNARTVLEKAQIKIYVGAGNMTVLEAYEAYKNNKLEKF